MKYLLIILLLSSCMRPPVKEADKAVEKKNDRRALVLVGMWLVGITLIIYNEETKKQL